MKKSSFAGIAAAIAGSLFLFSSHAMAVDLPVKTDSSYLSPESVPGATTVDTTEAHALWEQRAWFVDPRSDSDWQAGRIPGATHIKYDPGKRDQELTAERLAQEVARDEPVVFYCNSEGCDRSSWAAALAAEWGWEEVYYYRQGFPSWKAAGNPVE
jgi:rhodanese-related sulfurtransferase